MSAGQQDAPPEAHSREQTRAATRAAILNSAERNFLDKGYRGANLDEIAEDAGYSKGAIYSNFTSKQELFLAVGTARGDRTAKPLLEAIEAPGSADDKLAAFGTWIDSISAVDNEWILTETEFTLSERRSPEVATALRDRYRMSKIRIAEVLTEQLDASGISPVVDVEILAEMMVALESGLALSYAVDPEVRPNHFMEVFRALIART